MKRIFYFIVTWMIFVSSVVFVGCKKEENPHSRYEIIVEYAEETKTLMGTLKVTFENQTDNEICLLKFQLYPNAYRKNALYKPVGGAMESSAYYDGESYGEMVISSVHGAKNWEVMGEDENILYVDLERSIYPGESVVLDIGFMTKLANVNHRTGVTSKTVNLGNFYPILCGIKNGEFKEVCYHSIGEPFFSDFSDYKVTLTLPKEYVVASSGVLDEERMLESKKEYTMSATNVRNFGMVLSKNFRVLQEKMAEKTLRYYYYDDVAPEATMEIIKESFAFYEKTFGEYPYMEYAVAETGLCMDEGGYSALTLVTDGLTKATRSRVISRGGAYQWWSEGIGSDKIENAWQGEGMAEYSAILFFENYEKYGFTREGLIKNAVAEYRSYYDVYGSVLGRTDTRMMRELSEYASEYEYKCLTRDKAVIMLDALRKSVGDEKFFSSMKRYYKANLYKLTGVGDLVGAFEKNSLDVGGFFESFLQGKGGL